MNVVEEIRTSRREQISIVLPNQLFESPKIPLAGTVYLVEEYLYFKQFNFHQAKLAFHRSSMKFYQSYLEGLGYNVVYVDAQEEVSDIRALISAIKLSPIKTVHLYDPVDEWLNIRISAFEGSDINVVRIQSPLFLNTTERNEAYFKADRKRYLHKDFYEKQRKYYRLLIDELDNPIGGKWSFDTENRKKYPRKKVAPRVPRVQENEFIAEAKVYVTTYFGGNIGAVEEFNFPISFTSAREWFEQFLAERFVEFGVYEDAMVVGQHLLHHSLLSPLLNVGLITPKEVLERVVNYANEYNIPINSTEGLVRQVVGWREFVRGIYEVHGNQERTTNYWGFTRKIPTSFYDGTTGIEPVDIVIKSILKTGYCHHIERLMVLGNFMLLCEFDPDEVYRWFMELFIDAYDWVMVPNVYGMSQFADGGLLCTKPYISGSNYLIKMSNFPKGEWQQTWDGLFWRFMNERRAFFLKNPRLGMLIRMYDKMDDQKQMKHYAAANKFLSKLAAS